MIFLNTECKNCIHVNVCNKKGKPKCISDDIKNYLDNIVKVYNLTIKVICEDYTRRDVFSAR